MAGLGGTNYHELLMFLVEDMHIGLGGYTTDREYFKKKSQGLFDAPCFQLRTGIGYARFMQLRKFFLHAQDSSGGLN